LQATRLRREGQQRKNLKINCGKASFGEKIAVRLKQLFGY
jgi:hypothetical protein